MKKINFGKGKSVNYTYFVGDFETTVYDGQTETEVWASAVVPFHSEAVKVFDCIEDTWDYLVRMNTNVMIYYHNLKFDGNFWISFFLNNPQFHQAIDKRIGTLGGLVWLEDRQMANFTYKYQISDMGQWYEITVKMPNGFIKIRDSLKLIPLSVAQMGKAFNTKHRKLEMEYKGNRHAHGIITDEEKAYIANDVLVVKEALEYFFAEGHTKMTIGACCMDEFKKTFMDIDWVNFFPDLTKIDITKYGFKETTADAFIRKSYKGGWCYLQKGKEAQVHENGLTLDVNSLYPSMMSSQSGNEFPVGKPFFWSGNYIEPKAELKGRFYFIRVKTRFYLKKDKLPFIQIKGDYLYKGTEMLETSDIYIKGKRVDHYYDENERRHDTRVELTLTQTDYNLFREHYDVKDFEILGGCWFYTQVGIFDFYINKWKKIKMESQDNPGRRTISKLFLNNLYGKMSSSTDSSFKVAFLKPDGSVGFQSVPAQDKDAGFIAIGSAITSYARNFTIRAAQANYKDFIYSDTDSIHLTSTVEELQGVEIDDTDFCHWALESRWDKAIFVRQKTYIEHITGHGKKGAIEDCEPYYDIKAAGMPQRCKQLFEMTMKEDNELNGEERKRIYKMSPDEEAFLFEDKMNRRRYTLTDFKIGLVVPGKLMPKRIPGGVLLTETNFEMRA